MGLSDEAQKRIEDERKKSVYNTYNEFKEKGDLLGEKTLSWLAKYWEQIISLVLAFLLIGIQQFAQPNFDPLFFLRPDFWFEYLPYVMSIWIVIFSTTTGNMKWLVEVDKDYLIAQKGIQEHVNKNKKTPYIYKGSLIVDRQRKTKAWKTKVSIMIDKKRRKKKITSIDALRAFIEGDDTIVKFKLKVFQRSRKARIRRKFVEYFSYLEDAYINEYYDTLKVDYNRVTETVLVSGLIPTGNENNDTDFKENFGEQLFGEFGLGFIMFSLLSGLILALDLTSKEASMGTVVMFVFKAFMLYTYYFRASARSKPIFQKTRLKALQERESMLDYIERLIAKEKSVTD